MSVEPQTVGRLPWKALSGGLQETEGTPGKEPGSQGSIPETETEK